MFLECSKCFYLDRKLGVSRPRGFPFNLNAAVDTLLKKEFDIHRAKGTSHPLMETYGIDAVPFQHPMMQEWRNTFKGVRFHHKQTNFTIMGAVDDIWINPEKELLVVDYKATSKGGEVSIEAPWQIAYKRQMEVYQWLLRQNGFTVSDTGYFVYCNGKTDVQAFDGKLEFDISILPYKGSDTWVEKILEDIRSCLINDNPPESAKECEFCQYRASALDALPPHKNSPQQQKLI